jgi:hypothetical protein
LLQLLWAAVGHHLRLRPQWLLLLLLLLPLLGRLLQRLRLQRRRLDPRLDRSGHGQRWV